MPHPSAARLWMKSRGVWLAVAATSCLLAVAVAVAHRAVPGTAAGGAAPRPVFGELSEMFPVVSLPPTRDAASARLDDHAEVIGVSAGGRFRAYELASLAPADRHALNDVVGGVAVTVTYCNMSNCVRVFTDTAT